MKMRASLSKVLLFGVPILCVAAIVSFIFASHNGKTALRGATAGKSLLAKNGNIKPASANRDPKWAEAYGKLPMGFEENKGQTNSEVRFLAHGQGYQLFLTAQETVLEARGSKPLDFSPRHRAESSKKLRALKRKAPTSVVRMQLAGANTHPQIMGLNQLPGKTDYFIGGDSKKWQTGVPSYARVKYTGVYPGVDLVFYGNQRRLEYDYVIAPGANPNAIALDITGARKLRIDAQGNLEMSVEGGDIELQKPVAYQEMNGQRQLIASNYTVSGDHRVSFSLGNYDRSQPLVVDPVLNYSTYLGGSAIGDVAYGIAVDGAGDAYLAGLTYSPTFPTTSANAFDSTPTAAATTIGAVFVTELNPTGSAELYSTYLGGSGGEFAFGVAVDTSSPTNVYVTGQTLSDDYPTTANAYIPTVSGNAGSGFISKINPSVSGTGSLVYSSYVAGTNGDYGNAIAVDSSQNAFITGITFSDGISTTGAYQTAPTDSTDGNAFLTEIATSSSGGASLVYSTYLGGTGANAANLNYADQGFGVAVGSGKAYIVGSTASTDFPTVNGYQTSPATGNVLGTVFVSEIDPTQTGAAGLVYSTYLSGEVFDDGFAIALGQNGVVYATGTTKSTLFPITSGAFQTTEFGAGAGSDTAFVTLIDTTQTGTASLKYSTYLGGDNGDEGQGIQVDSAGNAYVAGATGSIGGNIPAFPVTPGALQTTSTNTEGVAFVSELSPNGSGSADLVYSTIFGGSGTNATPDRAFGIALDSANNAYIAGEVSSTDFPVYATPPNSPFQSTLTGSDAASITSGFAAELTLTPTVVVTPTTLAFGTVLEGNTSAAQTVTITNNTGTVVPYTLTNQTGNTGDFAAVPGGTAPCGATLAANNTPCTISVTFTPSTAAAETTNLVVGYTPYGIASSQTVVLTGTGSSTAFTVSPTTFTFPTPQLAGTTSAPTTITITNANNTTLAFTTNSTDTNDFTIQPGGTTPCSPSAGIPANSSCTFTATLNPASGDTGTLTTTFSVTANATTLTDVLIGTGQDFQLTPPSPASVSVAPGGTGSLTVTATFLGGFTGPVTLSCSGSIPQGSCTVPGMVSASGSSSVTVPITVTLTTKGSSMAPPASLKTPPISRRQVMLIGFAILLLFTVPFARQRRAKLGLVGALVMIVGLAACSGSSGTPAGAYNLTITGTSNGVTRTAAITLNVT
jgi:Beta-propeller repeat